MQQKARIKSLTVQSTIRKKVPLFLRVSLFFFFFPLFLFLAWLMAACSSLYWLPSRASIHGNRRYTMGAPWKKPAISYPDVFYFGQCHRSKSNNSTLFPWHSSSDNLVTTSPYLQLCCARDEYHVQNNSKQIKKAKLVNPLIL